MPIIHGEVRILNRVVQVGHLRVPGAVLRRDAGGIEPAGSLVLACPRYGGRLRVIATVQDPAVVRTILAHLARSGTPEPPGPAPPAPAALA